MYYVIEFERPVEIPLNPFTTSRGESHLGYTLDEAREIQAKYGGKIRRLYGAQEEE